MNIKATIAKAIANTSLKVAKAAGGTASYYGPYQPKEPANLKNIK